MELKGLRHRKTESISGVKKAEKNSGRVFLRTES